MRYRETQCRVAPVSKDGGGPMVRDAAHKGCGIWVGLRSRLLTMRAEKSRVCVKLIGIRFSARGVSPLRRATSIQRLHHWRIVSCFE
jgi:hypothetical protein